MPSITLSVSISATTVIAAFAASTLPRPDAVVCGAEEAHPTTPMNVAIEMISRIILYPICFLLFKVICLLQVENVQNKNHEFFQNHTPIPDVKHKKKYPRRITDTFSVKRWTAYAVQQTYFLYDHKV